MSTLIYFMDKDNVIFELSKFASFKESFDDPRYTDAITTNARTFIIHADLSLISNALSCNNYWTAAKTETKVDSDCRLLITE